MGREGIRSLFLAPLDHPSGRRRMEMRYSAAAIVLLVVVVCCCSDVALGGRVTSIPHRGALYDGLAMRAINNPKSVIAPSSADAPEQWFTQVRTPRPPPPPNHQGDDNQVDGRLLTIFSINPSAPGVGPL
jgi:hypothetical protein